MRNAKQVIRKGAALCGAFLLWTGAVQADVLPDAALAADVVILGEVHDNAAHHLTQAAALMQLAPKAVVWEMISADQAQRLAAAELLDSADIADLLDWNNSGWPAFDLYAPVFAAAAGAAQYGGHVPRQAARTAMETGSAAAFGAEAVRFGMDRPLPADQQAVQEADQMASHCDALPQEMLPLFVDVQRLRDATLARAVTQALAETGGPVAVITGNGHARRDRGVPVYLEKAAPEAVVFVLGQSEAGQIEGTYDAVQDAEPAERPDPCAVFQKG